MSLPSRVRDWPAEWRYRFEERAGIIEYDGCRPRYEAERMAEWLVRLQHDAERVEESDNE